VAISKRQANTFHRFKSINSLDANLALLAAFGKLVGGRNVLLLCSHQCKHGGGRVLCIEPMDNSTRYNPSSFLHLVVGVHEISVLLSQASSQVSLLLSYLVIDPTMQI